MVTSAHTSRTSQGVPSRIRRSRRPAPFPANARSLLCNSAVNHPHHCERYGFGQREIHGEEMGAEGRVPHVEEYPGEALWRTEAAAGPWTTSVFLRVDRAERAG